MRSATRAFVAILSVFVLALGIAACGGDSSSSDSGDSPLDNALGYVPKGAPFVASIDTDPRGKTFTNGKAILEKFPFASQIEQGITSGLKGQNVDYNRDIKPLLGNEFVVGATDVRSFTGNSGNDRNFVGAVQAKDGEKLKSVLEKEKPKELGEKSGATLYQDDDTFFALKDDVLVVAGTRKLLEDSVARREGDDHFTEADFDKGTADLPKDAGVRTYFDLQALLRADPDTADAQKVKWVKALRGFGLTAAVEKDRLRFDFKLGTDEGSLTDADLPLAAGDESPEVIDRTGEIGFGLRGLDQIFKFGENAGQAVDPGQFSSYETAKQTVEKQLDVDIEEDLIEQLSGDISVSTSVTGRFGLKAELQDSAEFKRTLVKLGKVLPGIIESSTGQKPQFTQAKGANGLYSLTTSGQTVSFGVIDGDFVASDTPANARAAASAPTSKVEGAEGALSMRADAAQLINQGIRQSGLGSGLGLGGTLGTSLFTGPLGDLTGSAKVDRSGLTGNFSLTFK